MTWNYRVVETADGLRVFDVYYNDKGEPSARHEQPTFIYGASVEELQAQVALISQAFELPVLKDSAIGTSGHVA